MVANNGIVGMSFYSSVLAGQHKDVVQKNGAMAISPQTLADLREGRHEAYETVYLHYVRPVRDFLTVLIGTEEEAREVTQEVFILLWESRSKIKPEKNIAGFLYTLARNRALNLFNHKKVVEKYEASLADWSESGLAADELLIAREKELLIELAVSKMPPQRRKVYKLSRVDNLSNDEIANQLSISKNTVENHITSALKDLRKITYLFLLVMLNS